MRAAVGILNLNKQINTVSTIRTAEHFGIKRIFMIGEKDFKGKMCMNCDKHMLLVHFKTEEEFIKYIKKNKYKLVLFEKSETSINISNCNFPDDVILMSGHERRGFSEFMIENADLIVHIPNVGLVNCMNTAAAFSIGTYKYFEQKVLK